MTEKKNKPRVLVVDDEPFTLETLQILLESGDCEVVAASGGREAQDLVARLKPETFDCALIDYRMPEITGLELLAWLRQLDATLASIILTAEGEKDLVANSLRSGACDFLDKPAQTRQIRQAVQKAVELTRERRYLRNAATEVQAIGLVQEKLKQAGISLVVEDGRLAHSPSIDTLLFPIKETGGDFFNYHFLDGRKLFLLAGDVSGHDLKAGFIAAYFQGIVRGMAEKKAGIEEICQFFNTFLVREWNDPLKPAQVGISLSACLILLDFEQKTISVLNSGFPLTSVACPEAGVAFIGEVGSPLGWFEPMDSSKIETPLPPQGLCYLWCDGLEDYAEELGVSPFALAYRLLHEPDEERKKVILQYHKDDILVFRVGWQDEARLAGGQRQILEPLLAGGFASSRLGEIDHLQEAWERSLKLALPQLADSRAQEIVLCLREAVIHTLSRGNGAREIKCAYHAGMESGRARLRLGVKDDSDGSKPENNHRPNAGPPPTGLLIIQGHADVVRTSPDGSNLEIEFNLQDHPA